MKDLTPALRSIVGDVAPVEMSAVWGRVARRRRHRITQFAALALVVLGGAAALMLVMADTSEQGEQRLRVMGDPQAPSSTVPSVTAPSSAAPPVTAPPVTPVFGSPSGHVLVVDDGVGGVVAVDLDQRMMVHRQLEGQRGGDQPSRLSEFGDEFLVGWSGIYAWNPETNESRLISDAGVYVEAAEPDRVWLALSTEATGPEDVLLQWRDVDGTVRYEGNVAGTVGADHLDPGRLHGITGGLAIGLDNSLVLWDASSDRILHTFDVGAPVWPVDARGDLIVWSAEGDLHLSTLGGDDQVIEEPSVRRPLDHSARLSPDGELLAVPLLDGSGVLIVSTADSSRQLLEWEPEASDTESGASDTRVLAWAPDSQQLFVVGRSYGETATPIWRWDRASSEVAHEILPFGGVIEVQAIEPDHATGVLEVPADTMACPMPLDTGMTYYPNGRDDRPCHSDF